MSPAVIGIDLGTTYSCVGVTKDGQVKIVANHHGKHITPSVVAFEEALDDAIYLKLVGDDAKEKAEFIPEATIFCVKRLMGRPYSDPTLEDDLQLWPFKVVDGNGKPKYQVEVNGKTYSFFPEEISAFILGSMKKMAEDYLQEEISGAVITVPAYFNEGQRIATRSAAEIAGIKVLELLSEPTAAAIAYGVDMQSQAARTVLVFDFGGGTFDVSLIRLQGNHFTILATGGDPHLGGEDIDNNLALHFENMFNSKHNTQLRADNPKAWRRLKEQCEKLKIRLSKVVHANLKIDQLHEQIDLNATLTRAKLEEINDDLFRKAISITDQVITRSRLKKDEISDLLLVGGSTRIPKIRKLLRELLPMSSVPQTIDVDQVVAQGATILAAEKTNSELNRQNHITLWNVLPLSLGIGTRRGIMRTLIERDTRVPVSKTITLSTEEDDQTIVRFKVLEGESQDTSRNYKLGEFRIAGIPPAPRGVPQIQVTFSVNEECTLEVTARDLATSREKVVKIKYDHERLDKSELEKLKDEYKKFEMYEKEIRNRIMALDDLEQLTKSIRSLCLGSKVPESVTNSISEIFTWIDQWHQKKSYPAVGSTLEKKDQLKGLYKFLIEQDF